MSYRRRLPLGQAYPAMSQAQINAYNNQQTTELVLVAVGGIAVLGGLFWLSSWKRKKLKESLGDAGGEAASLGLGLLTGI